MRQPSSEAGPDGEGEVVLPPMHIAIVTAALGAGGAERVVSLMTGAWAAKGHRVTIVTFDEEGAPIFHPLDPRVQLRRLGITRGGGAVAAARTLLQRCRMLRRTLDTLRPDVTISFLTKINVLTLIANLGRGRCVVVSERNNPRLQRASRLWTLALAGLHWRADVIVMQTQASLECLGMEARQRAVVIPNPITIGAPVRREGTHRVLAATGRLTWQKGFDLLLDAFARIADRHPGWRLVIWGEGEDRADLERQILKRGLPGRVSLPGNSGSPEEWVEQADAFVLSSRYEGFSNALGEAMAAGLPVVAFDCRYSPSELIRHDEDGLLVADGDVAALAEALDRLLGDEGLRDRLSRAARVKAERYRPEAVIAQWERVLADATGR